MLIARIRVLLRICAEIRSLCVSVDMRAQLITLLQSCHLWPLSSLSDFSLAEIGDVLTHVIKLLRDGAITVVLARSKSTIGGYFLSHTELEYVRTKLGVLRDFLDHLLQTPFCIICVAGNENLLQHLELDRFSCCGYHEDCWYFRNGSPNSCGDGIRLWEDSLLETPDSIKPCLYGDVEYQGLVRFPSHACSNPASEYQLRRSNLISKLWTMCRQFELRFPLS